MARILIIEDNPANLELMTYLLRAFGHTPLVARDGEAGLETARRERLDLIICDVQLPKLDGYAVIRRLKDHPALRAIPVVAVTALAMVGDRDKVLGTGFDGYIAKPIQPETFVAQVEAFLQPDQRLAASPPAAALPAASAPTDKRPTILIVDNSPVNLQLMTSLLEPSGYHVLIAHSTPEALALARQFSPELIISDVHMPGEDGFAFIRRAKADARLSTIPFVFISSTVWKDKDEKEGLTLGAVRFIRRPIEPPDLLKEIEACLKDSVRDSSV